MATKLKFNRLPDEVSAIGIDGGGFIVGKMKIPIFSVCLGVEARWINRDGDTRLVVLVEDSMQQWAVIEAFKMGEFRFALRRSLIIKRVTKKSSQK